MMQLQGQEIQAGGDAFPPVPLPRGAYRIDASVDRLLRASAGAPPGERGEAHPIFAFIATLGGMGVSVAELCRMCGASIDDGPVLARCTIRFHRPLSLDRNYTVDGEITAITRKKSRRFGAADHVTIELTLSDEPDVYTDVSIVMVMPQGRQS